MALANAALKRLIERGAVDQAFVAAHTEGWDELVAALDGQPTRRPARAGRASPPRSSTRSSTCTPARRRRDPRLVDGHHPAPRRASTACGPSSTSAWPAATSAATAPGSCRSAATPACRAAPRWAPTPPRCPGGAAGRRRATPPRSAEQWGFAVPDRARAAPRPRWSRPPSAGELDVLWTLAAATSSRCCPTRRAVRGRARPGAAAGPPGHRAHLARCWSTGDDVILLPVATRYEQEGGGTETTTERRIVFSPEIPRQVGRGPQRVAPLRRRGRPGPARPAAGASPGPTNQALRAEIADGRARLRRHRDAGRHRRPGAVGRPPPLRRRRVPARRRAGAASPPLDAAGARPARRARSRWPPAGASSSTRWCTPRSTRSPAPAATPSSSTRPTPPRLGLGDGDRRSGSRSDDRHATTGTLQAGPPARPHAAGPLARGQRAHRRRPRPPRAAARKVPDYNAVVWVEPLPA